MGYEGRLLALGCFGIEEEVDHVIYWLLEFILTILNKKKARKRRSSACCHLFKGVFKVLDRRMVLSSSKLEIGSCSPSS